MLNIDTTDAPLLAVSDTETLEIEIIGKRGLIRLRLALTTPD